MIEMHFYVTKNKDGLYHVQNTVMGHFGQHHIHNKKSFNKWKKGIPKKYIHILEGTSDCNCGLMKSGDVRDHEGNVSHNDRFEGEP
jgi:hypothetical protein